MNDEEHFKDQKNFKETTCLDENHTVTSEKAIFFIGNRMGNSLFTLAFNKDNKKIKVTYHIVDSIMDLKIDI